MDAWAQVTPEWTPVSLPTVPTLLESRCTPHTPTATRTCPTGAPDAAAFIGSQPPEYVTELMSPQGIARNGYFDPDKVARLVAKLQRAKVPAARDNMAFVGILSTQLWHAQFVAGRKFE